MLKHISNFHYLTQDLEDRTHAEQTSLALKGGTKWVQFRTKELKNNELLKEALKIKKLCSDFNAQLIINDYVELAKEIKADGVHLGKEDLPVSVARNILGSDYIIGATVNSKEDLARFNIKDVNYLGVGPFRHTSTKKNLSAVLNRVELEKLISEIRKIDNSIPIILIGGIRESDLDGIFRLGVDGVAVAGGVNLERDPANAVGCFVRRTSTFSSLAMTSSEEGLPRSSSEYALLSRDDSLGGRGLLRSSNEYILLPRNDRGCDEDSR